jgi:predicted O-linked N-acetylglucosamine transferase (SPINDLY family)
LANDLPKLATLRAGLRGQVRVSPLYDARRFARNFEEALWGMWQASIQNNISNSPDSLNTLPDSNQPT